MGTPISMAQHTVSLCICRTANGYYAGTCDVDLSGVTVLLLVGGDTGPTTDVGGLLGIPLNTSSSFCVSCAKP